LVKKKWAQRIPSKQNGILVCIPHEGKGVQLAIEGTDLVDAAVVGGGIKSRTEKSFIRRVRNDFHLAAPKIRK
jgi:hypothetical protein